MLSPTIIEEVRRLLAEGQSRRQIARMLDICRNTVNRIADGERTDHEECAETMLSSITRKKPKRCRTCGGMVYPPCKLCRLRALINNEPRQRAAVPSEVA